MNEVDAVAIVIWIGATLYVLLAGADFGAGLWDLLAGDARRGARPRALMDRVLTPVWEANHVWLVFLLVFTWTGFPEAFAAIMSTLFVPLMLAALGIVLRGAGFAFRHLARGIPGRRALGATFALSSVLTPFFMGTVVGAIATGRVPADGDGDRLTSWCNLPSFVIGALFVATGAYLAAVYLTREARKLGDEELRSYFRTRALAAAAVTGALAVAGLIVLRADARELFDDLLSDALPLVIVSVVCGVGCVIQLLRDRAGARLLAIGAVVGVVWAWGVAQRHDILPGELTLDEAAAPSSTLTALLIVFGVALLTVGPAIAFLLTLHQRALLEEGEDDQ